MFVLIIQFIAVLLNINRNLRKQQRKTEEKTLFSTEVNMRSGEQGSCSYTNPTTCVCRVGEGVERNIREFLTILCLLC